MIDLSRMKHVEVDPEARIARAGGGATWGEVDAATQVYGLATPGGVFSRTGIAGLTLGGGFGWLRNTYGLSCDNLVAAQVVTADGRVLRASETDHGRHAAFLLSPEANWEDPRDDSANIRWAREFIADMREFSDGGRYLNFAGFQEEGDKMMRGAFGPQYDRLVALKRQYDPSNLFRLNQNIPPGVGAGAAGR